MIQGCGGALPPFPSTSGGAPSCAGERGPGRMGRSDLSVTSVGACERPLLEVVTACSRQHVGRSSVPLAGCSSLGLRSWLRVSVRRPRASP